MIETEGIWEIGDQFQRAWPIKKVLPTLLKSDQTAYVKGRFIGESSRLIGDILETTNNLPGFMVTMDIEKAFDSVDHKFIFKVMEHAGVWENFITHAQDLQP